MKRPPKKPRRKKGKAESSKGAIRRPYTWYLRPPFVDRFDRTRWWVGLSESDYEPDAALFELARRHPSVCDGLLNRNTEPSGKPPSPGSLHWTCLVGLTSWEKLNYTERRNWRSSIGNLKGLDFRSVDVQGRCLKVFAHWSMIDRRREALRNKAASEEELDQLVNAELRKNPPTADEWEAAIAERAIEAYRSGYVLLAIAPNLITDTAQGVMSRKYREHRRLYPVPTQRARWHDWLGLISAFEDAEMSGGKDTSQAFERYRRAVDGIRFT